MNAFKKGVTVFLKRFQKRFPDTAFIWKEKEAFGYKFHECFSLDNEKIFEIADTSRRDVNTIAVLSDSTEFYMRIGNVGRQLPKFKQSACFMSAEIMRRWKLKRTK